MPRAGYCANERRGNAADAFAAAFIGWVQGCKSPFRLGLNAG
jgi:hypothetical protein